jgi:hypothetical protein
MIQIRKGKPAKEATKKAAKNKPKKEVLAKKVAKTKKVIQTKTELKLTDPVTTEAKVLDYINKHPSGVRIAEMEEPLGETRMKLGFIAKNLLDEGKVLKIETVYYPTAKLSNLP